MAEQVRPMQYHEEERFKFDAYAHAVTMIAEQHRMIHDGFMYDISGKALAVAAAASVDVLFTMAAGVILHLTNVEYTLDEAPVLVELYENVVTSADGTAALVSNHNRLSSNTPGSVVTIGPTITDIGDLLHERYIPAAGKDTGLVVKGADREWILGNTGTPNKYLWRITNNTPAAITIGYHFNGYEIGYTQNRSEEFDDLSGS